MKDKVYMKEISFFINHLYAVYKAPIRCMKGQEVVLQPDMTIRDADPLILDKNLRNSLIAKWTGAPFLDLENDMIFYGVCCDTTGLACILGPVAFENLGGSELYQYKQNHGLLNYNDFKITKGSIFKAASVLALLHQKMNNEQIDMSDIIEQLTSKQHSNRITEKEKFNYSFQNAEQNRERLPYRMERSIMNAFSNGDLEIVKSLKNTNLFDSVGIMANKSFKQMEYTAIAGITLFDRAAIEGGANYEEVHNIVDLHFQKIALCRNELEIQEIYERAITDLNECVKRAKIRYKGLKYIEQCKRFVIKHLHKKFTLDDIANDIGMNKCYLTHQFSKQEGKSLKRYIQEERIMAAQNMLKYSDQTISAVSSYFCFDSQSHFGSVFKNITGITPSEYRTRNKVEYFGQKKDSGTE